MTIKSALKNTAFKMFNGGYSEQEMLYSTVNKVSPAEARKALNKMARRTHVNPVTKARQTTLFHNSKYAPDGSARTPGEEFTDYKDKGTKAILTHNQEVTKNSHSHRSVTARMTGLRGSAA